VFNPEASGAFFGIKRLHTRGHFFRSILEAWGYSIRYGLDSYYPQGHPLKRLIATGGGARSPLWRQIVSDITGIRQEYVPNSEGTLADAYLAGMALNWFDDFDILKNQWIKVTDVTEPDPNHKIIYDETCFQTYVDLHAVLNSFSQRHRISA
jgi:xylulokinase